MDDRTSPPPPDLRDRHQDPDAGEPRRLVPMWMVLARLLGAGVALWVAFVVFGLALMTSDGSWDSVVVPYAIAGAIAGTGIWAATVVVRPRALTVFALAGAVALPPVLIAIGYH